MLKITKVSMWSGIEHTRKLNITQEQYNRWQNGELIQNVMPHLSDNEREFLISGTSDEEQEEIFSELEEPDESDIDLSLENDAF